jgi:two-component system chemotaxis response regulator CheY
MRKAMVVDDSRVMRLILADALSEAGYDVCQAANGKQALSLLEADSSVSLALVDWNMPEMNGIEFIRHVRARPGFSNIPLMMVTTETEVDQIARALEEGANEYVMKPFTTEIIIDKLRLMGLVE